MILRRWIQAICVAGFAAVLLPGFGRAQQVAGSVESGLQSLAQDIVTKSVAQDRNSIAVLPFPNADGSCSVLSTYIADELIQALFSIPNSPLSIIERNQLEAIVNEIQIGAGGLLNPETTQSLGKVSGVKALTVGTITQIGDRVRINARLVATDTGRTISAAAISIPRTSDIDSLLRQPIAGEGGTCGVRLKSRMGPTIEPSTAPTQMSGIKGTGGDSGGGQVIRSTTVDDLAMTAQTVSRSADKKTVTMIVSLVNKKPEPVQIVLTAPKPSIIDDATNDVEATTVNGVGVCNNFGWDAHTCASQFRNIGFATLTRDVPVTLLLRFQSKEAPINGRTLSFAATILKMPRDMGSDSIKAMNGIDTIPITFANLSISDPAGR